MTKLAKLFSAVVIALATASAAGCAVDEGDRDLHTEGLEPVALLWDYDGTEEIQSLEQVEPPTTDVMAIMDLFGEGDAPDAGICICTTAECAKNYVIDNFGCGTCYEQICSGRRMGGCYPCEDPDDSAPSERHPSDLAQ